MYIISLTYKVPLSMIDEHLDAHVAYLKEQYAAGNFLMSGRKVPRSGGIIVSNVTDRETLNDLLSKDPFNVNGLADYEVIEFVPTMSSDALHFLINSSS